MRLPSGFRKIARQRKDGTVHFMFEARTYKSDRTGKRKRFSVYGSTVEEAKLKLKELESRNIGNFDADKTTLASYFDTWLKGIKATRAWRTYELYESLIRNHIIPHIGGLRLSQVTPENLRWLLTDALEDIGSRSRQLVHRVLRYALTTAVEEEVIHANPCLRKDKPRHKIAEFKALSESEVQKFLETAKQGNFYTLFFLALETGMRQGEIFGLQWSSVDFDGMNIWVKASLTRNEDGLPTLTSPKASRKRRVDLSPQLLELLREHRRQQYPLSPWVFTQENGQPLHKDRFIRTVFRPLLKAAEIQRIRFHDLRHTAATLALSSGDNIKVVAEKLGHSSAKMTLDVYAKAIPTLQRNAADRMGGYLSFNGSTNGGTQRGQQPEKAQK